jgi:hypothetical protein
MCEDNRLPQQSKELNWYPKLESDFNPYLLYGKVKLAINPYLNML